MIIGYINSGMMKPWKTKIPVKIKRLFDESVSYRNMLVLVINPTSPYRDFLDTVAIKVTSTRFRLDVEAFINGCETLDKLKQRIDKFKTFICPGESPNIDRFLNSLSDRYNLVTMPDNTANTYILVNIDPDNEELHRFLSTDKAIVENTMRVEGCRLIVKESFFNIFKNRLAANGFPCETL